jgi:hypothetical protein
MAAMILSTYQDALRLAQQQGDDRAIRLLRREIGGAEPRKRIEILAHEPTYTGDIARLVLTRRLRGVGVQD